MDLKYLRQLIRQGHSVVLVEEGQPPLVVSELRPATVPVPAPGPTEESESTEVPIASRWPKGRSIHSRQEQVLERLNKEILALQGALDQEEGSRVE